MLHMNLFRPVRNLSLGGNKYGLIIIDNFSKFIWILFLAHKSETFKTFKIFAKKMQNEKGLKIVSLRINDRKKFDNLEFINYCDKKEINQKISTSYTPQQNGVVERKNRIIQ